MIESGYYFAMPQDLASALTVLRICRGWTRTELASASGVPNSSLSQYERGQKTPELRTLSRLVEAMGFPLAAVDETRTFLSNLRAGRIGSPESPRLSQTQGALDVDRLATEVGSAAERLSRALLLLLDRAETRVEREDQASPASRHPT
jgi:transcriptional regulator with XRE-family HTH domain